MKQNTLRGLLLIISIFLSVTQTTFAAVGHDAAIEQEILVHINAYRQHHGLSPLKMDERITKEAKKHSLDMARHAMPFGHAQFNGRIKRLYAQIKNTNGGAENVAYNYKDARDVVSNWVRSPGHRRNIEGNYNLTGIGIARDARGKIYFTQIFLKTGTNGVTIRRAFRF